MHTIRNINSYFTSHNGTENYNGARIPTGIRAQSLPLVIKQLAVYCVVFYYRHLFGGLFTDGVRAVAEEFQAYWLIDAVFSYNRKEEFQIWALEVSDRQGILTMREDSNMPFIVKQDIPFTDFPEGILKMYFTEGVLLLPSEY